MENRLSKVDLNLLVALKILLAERSGICRELFLVRTNGDRQAQLSCGRYFVKLLPCMQ
ncbi:MAG: hypothetical protein ACR2PS_12425 [Pseudomonadales bacterium]